MLGKLPTTGIFFCKGMSTIGVIAPPRSVNMRWSGVMLDPHVNIYQFPRDLQPEFPKVVQTPSQVGGVLAQMANDLPRKPDNESYRQILTRATNHLF
jgi:hypothetical protein